MRALRLLVRVVLVVVLLVVGAFVAAIVAISAEIPVSLEPFRGEFEAMVSSAIGRPFHIDGQVEVVPTWWPTLEVTEVRIAQPEGWAGAASAEGDQPEFASARRLFLRLAVFQLLSGKLRVLELSGEGVEINMERLRDGRANWEFEFASGAEEAPEEETEPVHATGEEPLVLELLGVDEIEFRDFALHYRRPGAVDWDYELAELSGVVALDAPLELEASGALQGQPYALEFFGGELNALNQRDTPWPMKVRIELAGSLLELVGKVSSRWGEGEGSNEVGTESAPNAESPPQPTPPPEESGLLAELGPFQFRALDLDMSLSGEQLQRFDPLIGIRLPPLGPYGVAGSLTLRDGHYSLTDLDFSVGSSRLTGKMNWNHLAEKPRFDLALRAHTIQLNDFRAWADQLAEEEALTPAADAGAEEPLTLSAELLRNYDGRVKVGVDKVVSGRDRLGGMQLALTLEKGRLRVHPFALEVPGGSAKVEFAYADTGRRIDLELGIDLNRFDYGVLARYLDPETEMSGLVSLNVALSSRAPTPEQLLNRASGHIDLALMPREFEAGVIDLWSVNLISSVLPTLDTSEKSVVECLIAQLDVKDGFVTQHALVVDTTRMRVSGKAEIDLTQETINLRFKPVPKRPEFFSLATPVRVEGTIDDFRVGVRPEDVIQTVVRFVTSVVVVPVQRLMGLKTDLSDDTICDKAMDRPAS